MRLCPLTTSCAGWGPRLLAGAAICLATVSASGQPEPPPWFRGFEARRAIEFSRAPRKGDKVLLRVGTSRVTRSDARDVRIVLDSRYPIPMEILEAGPGDTCLLRFEVLDETRKHHVYLGSSSAGRPPRPRQPIRGGLLLEVLALGEGSCDSWQEMQKLIRASTDSLGYLAPGSISLGIPPLGRTGDYLARYTGLLQVDKVGAYAFETVSSGGSFVLVGGKVVASWPGFHGLSGYARVESRRKHSGTIELQAGTYPLEYLVATRRGGVHLLAWAPPGEDGKLPMKSAGEGKESVLKTKPVSARSFVRWLPARPGRLEMREEPLADFDWSIESDTGSDVERHDLALVAFRFSGDLRGRRPGRVRWLFGDGQEAEGEEVRHVYLRHGTYAVKVEAEIAGGVVHEATRTVVVRFEGLSRRNIDRLLEEYYTSTRDYDLESLPPEHLVQLLWLRSKDDRWEAGVWQVVDAWYRRGLPETMETPSAIEERGLKRAVELIRGRSREEFARLMLGALAGRSNSGERRDEARVWLAWLDAGASARGVKVEEKKAREATSVLKELYGRKGTTDASRRAGIFLAETHLGEGREQDAREILERAESADGFRKFTGNRGLSSGARSLSLDSLLREKRLEDARKELERWEWELPADLLDGTLQLQRARLRLARGRAEEAVRGLEAVLKLDGASEKWPRALLLQADALETMGNSAAARKKLERILEEFPHRPESDEANRRLDGKDGSAGGGSGASGSDP